MADIVPILDILHSLVEDQVNSATGLVRRSTISIGKRMPRRGYLYKHPSIIENLKFIRRMKITDAKWTLEWVHDIVPNALDFYRTYDEFVFENQRNDILYKKKYAPSVRMRRLGEVAGKHNRTVAAVWNTDQLMQNAASLATICRMYENKAYDLATQIKQNMEKYK